MERSDYKDLYAELEQYERFGISMKLGNYSASPMQIVSALMVKEERTYMRDYVWDDCGQIKELAFHSIDE